MQRRNLTKMTGVDPSGTGDGFAPFFAQNESGRLRVVCSQCHRTWYPTPISGISRYAGSAHCPDCGTDFRVWAAFQQIFGGGFGAD